MSRCRALVLITLLALLVPAVACGNRACADELAAGTRSYSPPSNSGSHTYSGGSSSRTYRPPSNSGSRASGGSSSYRAPSSSGSRTNSSSGGTFTGYAPNGSTYQLPSHITSSHYRSPVGRVYVYHVHSYYHAGGYHDPWDPYDPYNYSNPTSLWFGHAAYSPC